MNNKMFINVIIMLLC